MMQMLKKRKIAAWVALFAIVFVMLASMLFISGHAHHDCTGEDCPICEVLMMCETNLKMTGVVALVCICHFFSVRIIKSEFLVSRTYVFDSLISQKVRMND